MNSLGISAAGSRLPGFSDPATHFELDFRGMDLAPSRLAALSRRGSAGTPGPLDLAHAEMTRLENGEIKNPDEDRAVTHFTDRLTYTESDLFRDVEAFAAAVQSGAVRPSGRELDAVILNGIGGSALGPQFLQFAAHGPYWNELSRDARGGRPRLYFLDNTDSAGLADVLRVVAPAEALLVSVSKSGGTLETLNNLRGLEEAFAEAGLDFAAHAVAVTMPGSQLDESARRAGWLKIFPMAESIGGRTSETNIVGHVPAALAGIDFAAFVDGARHMDALTRRRDLAENPAYQLAAAWFVAGNGRGDRNMVIVPYADRLVLLGRYLQQLVMESLGKERDRDGNTVNQGLTVYGNKGGTDAHAYIQQLQDGRDDFFITFIEVLVDAAQTAVGEGLTMGDHLHAFKQGLVRALRGRGRQVIQITLESLTPGNLGMLVALYERAVAVYAELININAFHQPGVQAYKLASAGINELNRCLQQWIAELDSLPWVGRAAAAAAAAGHPDETEEARGILAKFAANGRIFAGRTVSRAPGPAPGYFRIAAGQSASSPSSFA